MTLSKVRFRVLLDEGVPDAAGRVFEKCGHGVIYHRDVILPGTDDRVVAATALENQAILVAQDADMKQIAQRYGMTARNDRFDRLSLIRLCCKETLVPKRLEYAMSFIEHEWEVCEAKASRRMWVEIEAHQLCSAR